jgi:hypothetical protein
MKTEDLQKKSKEELIDIVENFYGSPFVNIYFSVKTQADKLSKQIEEADIDFKDDSAPFKNFVLWSKESLTILDNIEKILAKIDKDILIKAQEKRVSAEDTTPESYVRKGR